MAFTYGFYNYSPNDVGADAKIYDAKQMSQLFDGLITDGVYKYIGDKFHVELAHVEGEVVINSDTIQVGSGRAWVNHTWNYNDSKIVMALPDPPAENERCDSVIIDVDNDTRTNQIIWAIGDEDGNLNPPTLINTDTHKQMALANVYREPGEELITNEAITNLVGTIPETPYVVGALESVYGQLQLRRSGRASATTISRQYLDVDAWHSYEVSGSAYMQQTIRLSTTSDVSCEFTNVEITDNTVIDPYYNLNIGYKSSVIDAGTGTYTITFPPYVAETDLTVRIYIRNE